MKERIRESRGLSRAISGITYVVALVVAVLVVKAIETGHPLVDLAVGTLVATAVVFAVSVVTDNSSIYDPYWSVQPLAIAGYYLWVGRADVHPRLILVTALVFLYASRLTSNFYRDWPGLGKEDFRYREMRARTGRAYWSVSFLGIHLMPTALVYLGCLPLYGVSSPEAGAVGWLDGLGIIVVTGAVALAFVADEQLRRFRRDPASAGQSIRSGLWAYSRHPNYLGEVSTWWGLWVFALASGVAFWWTVAGAAAITLLFVFISVPMMERRALAGRVGYREYRESVPMLLPAPRRPSIAVDPEGGEA